MKATKIDGRRGGEVLGAVEEGEEGEEGEVGGIRSIGCGCGSVCIRSSGCPSLKNFSDCG